MASARPAAEMEPLRSISSNTATLPGPMRTPVPRSMRMLNRSFAEGAGMILVRDFGMVLPNASAQYRQENNLLGYVPTRDLAHSAIALEV